MRELLQFTEDGEYAVAALGSVVYLLKGGERCIELMHSPQPSNVPKKKQQSKKKNSSKEKQDDQQQQRQQQSGSEGKEDDAGASAAAANRAKQLEDRLDVETVAVKEIDSAICCVVSRQDKTVCIYRLAASTISEAASAKPSIIHRVPKRISSLTFAAATGKSGSDFVLLLVGDLVGDIWALSLDKQQRRLMLGHTASMITGMCVSHTSSTTDDNATNDNANGSYLLSADRDEKVRISQFPNTENTTGFLLGHTAFITSMVCITKDGGKQVAFTASADGTIRTWDIPTMAQLHVTQVAKDVHENRGEDNEDADVNDQCLIPTSLAINESATLLSVIYDGSKAVQLYSIAERTHALQLVTSATCDAQPLSIQFNKDDELSVLLEAPHYCTRFKAAADGLTVIDDKEVNASAMSVLKQTATDQAVKTLSSVVEKDKKGFPQLRKLEEKRGPGGDYKPWERVERIEVAKKRDQRAKKRRRTQLLQQKQQEQGAEAETGEEETEQKPSQEKEQQ